MPEECTVMLLERDYSDHVALESSFCKQFSDFIKIGPTFVQIHI